MKMFRCKDCNLEYEQKPDYCDCGNDSFEEIQLKKEAAKSFSQKYPQIQNFMKSFDVLSTSIFVICIILSILSWIFIGKESPDATKNKKVQKHAQEQLKTGTKVPDINSLWDNTPPVTTAPVQEPEVEFNTGDQIQEQPKTIIEEQERNIKSSQLLQSSQKVAPVQKKSNTTSVKKKETNSNSAMVSYKSALRQVLFSHLAVTSVQGEGRCEIEFSVDKSGRLLNRRFSKLSNNKSLNDAVYNMLMSVPQYSPPPSGYNGEKIRLSFYFDNGYYEVSY